MSDAQASATPDAGNGQAAGAALLGGGASAGNGSSQPSPTPPGNSNQGHNSGGAFDANGDWRAFFAKDLEEPVAKDWQNISGRYQSPQEFAKGVVELRKSSVIVPKDDSKPEAWDDFYNKIGRPKDAKEYAFNWDKEIQLSPAEQEAQEGFRQVAHRNGLTQKQVNELVGWNGAQIKTQRDAMEAQARGVHERNIKALKAEWGPDFDRNVNSYNIAAKTYAGRDFDEFKSLRLQDGTFAADHPVLVRMMTRVGLERAEDDRDPTAFNANARESAQTQLQTLINNATAKGHYPGHPQWPHAEIDKLQDKIAGTRPLGPSQMFGRS